MEEVEMSTQEGYALWAPLYDNEKNALIAVEESRVDALLAALPVTEVLDVGTGTGRHALKMARRGMSVTAIDQSREMLVVAQEKAYAEGLAINFQLASLNEGLPFKEEEFGLVIAALMLCHIPNLAHAMQEFSRVLRPGGFLLLTDFHPEAIHRGWRTDFRRLETRYVLPNMPHTRVDYVEALVAGGFSSLIIMDIPVREAPEGYLSEGMRRKYSEELFCLIVYAQKVGT